MRKDAGWENANPEVKMGISKEAPESSDKEKEIRRAVRTLMEREGWDYTVNERLGRFDATIPWSEDETGAEMFVTLSLFNRKDALRMRLSLDVGEISEDKRPELSELLWMINQKNVVGEKGTKFIFDVKEENIFLERFLIFKEDAATPDKMFNEIERAKAWHGRYEHAIAAVIKDGFTLKKAFESPQIVLHTSTPVVSTKGGRGSYEKLLQRRMMRGDGRIDVRKFHPKKIFSATAELFGHSMRELCGRGGMTRG